MTKKKKQKKSRKPGGLLTTPLAGHKRVGKILVPPMLTLPGMSLHSWANERLPEMLWACLLVSVFPRNDALGAFREIAGIGLRYRGKEQGSTGWTMRMSDLAVQPPDILESVIKTVLRHPLGYAALRPLLLLDGLPGWRLWSSILGVGPDDDDWRTLGTAVAKTFDHQSQEATDVRWIALLSKMSFGGMYFDSKMEDKIDEIVQYPNKGDMRSVRPTIRSAEAVFAIAENGKQISSAWPTAFWEECMGKTGCVPARLGKPVSPTWEQESLAKELLSVRMALLDHYAATLATTGVDARHDAVFGFALFALSCLLEMISGLNGRGIAGRSLLRTLVECRVTLAYLARCGDEALWAKFRTYGSGQAKLALLKIDEMTGDVPTFVSRETLEALANEDFFQEYLLVDVGHWCGKDLRTMAADSGTKDDYDRFYGWASSYVHGHWGALRDSNMTWCLNPLHRFHRVPLLVHRRMEDAVPDALTLVNAIMDDVHLVYPGLTGRFQVSTGTDPAPSSTDSISGG